MTKYHGIKMVYIVCLFVASSMLMNAYPQDAPIATYSFDNYLDSLNYLSVSPDGTLISINGVKYLPHKYDPNAKRACARIIVLNLSTSEIKPIYDFDDKEDSTFPRSITFSPDGSQILAGFDPGTAFLLNAFSGEIIHTVTSDEPFKPCGIVGVLGDMFTSNGLQFVTSVTCTSKGILPYRVWDTKTGELNTELTQIFQTNIGGFPTRCLYNGVILSSTMERYDPHIQLFDLASKQIVHTFSGQIPIVSSNLRYVAYFNGDRSAAHVMDLKTFEEITHTPIKYDSSNFNPMSVSNKGVLVLSGKTGYTRKVIALDPLGVVYEYPIAKTEKEADANIAFVQDGNRFLTVNGTDINIWDISKITTAVKESDKY